MLSRFRPTLLVAVLCAGASLAGCSSANPDLRKVTFSRTTVPAAKQSTSGAVTSSGSPTTASGPAFSTAQLRLIDPCGLLDNNTLAAFGTPADSHPEGIGDCSNFMHDSHGGSLDLSVRVGADLSEAGDNTQQVDGMSVAEDKLSDGSACWERIITQTRPAIGIELQIDTDANPCGIGQQLAKAVIDHVRSGPPLRPDIRGSVASLDPCTLIDDRTAANVTTASPTKTPQGLFKCDWSTDDVDLYLSFDTGSDPKDAANSGPPHPVDLGGTTAYEFPSPDVYPSCEVKWLVRATDGATDGAGGEVADVEFDNTNNIKVDACAQAATAARNALTNLPKGP